MPQKGVDQAAKIESNGLRVQMLASEAELENRSLHDLTEEGKDEAWYFCLHLFLLERVRRKSV